MKSSMEAKMTGGTLGTFAGVFTPSLLTILGIILFLRLGFVIGNAGLASALIILALANLISILSSFSLAAVATNLKVKGGGDYYLISRTLGLEFGGAIGIVLFLAQSVSIAFYCIGFGEAVAAIFAPGVSLSPQWIGGCAVLLLFLLAWMGADWATRFQYGVDVEGKMQGIQADLVELLGKHTPIPVTYAGGASRFSDLERVKKLGQNQVDLTIGSALDIFGGGIAYQDVVDWHQKNS